MLGWFTQLVLHHPQPLLGAVRTAIENQVRIGLQAGMMRQQLKDSNRARLRVEARCQIGENFSYRAIPFEPPLLDQLRYQRGRHSLGVRAEMPFVIQSRRDL
jgi:hypothetical protein